LPDVIERETAAAASSVDREVVFDGSALAVLSLISEISDHVLSSFVRHRIPVSLRFDALNAADTFSSPAKGVLHWDSDAGRPVLIPLDPSDVAVWRDRANWIEDRLGLMHAEELDALPDFPGADPRQW